MHFEKKRIFACDTMTFVDLRHLFGRCNDARDHVADNADADEGADRDTDFAVIDLRAITGDDAGFLHAAYPFDYGRVGEADATTQFRKLNSRIFLEFGQYAPADRVQQSFHF